MHDEYIRRLDVLETRLDEIVLLLRGLSSMPSPQPSEPPPTAQPVHVTNPGAKPDPYW